jgi:hypothetical protein
MAEQWTLNPQVLGSNPRGRTWHVMSVQSREGFDPPFLRFAAARCRSASFNITAATSPWTEPHRNQVVAVGLRVWERPQTWRRIHPPPDPNVETSTFALGASANSSDLCVAALGASRLQRRLLDGAAAFDFVHVLDPRQSGEGIPEGEAIGVRRHR